MVNILLKWSAQNTRAEDSAREIVEPALETAVSGVGLAVFAVETAQPVIETAVRAIETVVPGVETAVGRPALSARVSWADEFGIVIPDLVVQSSVVISHLRLNIPPKTVIFFDTTVSMQNKRNDFLRFIL